MEQHQVKDIKNKIGCIFVVHPIIFICLGKQLYYCHNLSQTDDVFYDEERYENDSKLRKLQHEVSSQLHEYADRFNKLFNNIKDDDK